MGLAVIFVAVAVPMWAAPRQEILGTAALGALACLITLYLAVPAPDRRILTTAITIWVCAAAALPFFVTIVSASLLLGTGSGD